jgi:hypothetical protein
MHLTVGSPKASSEAKSRKSQAREHASSKYVIGEINAYIAIRDELLAEAEELRTRSKLDSLIIANDFVETCLTPSRPPYEAQHLPEADALRERRRCQEIKLCVANLRSQLELRADH